MAVGGIRDLARDESGVFIGDTITRQSLGVACSHLPLSFLAVCASVPGKYT